jgi:bromodomain-containing factor 1
LKAAGKIIAHCLKIKGSYWFSEPVDPVKYNILDYFDIVSTPMDLNTIRKKISHNCYTNPN